jgi:hypothetical protein
VKHDAKPMRIVAVPLMVAVASLAVASSNGPPPARTAAPATGGVAAEGSRVSCHGGTP